MSDPALPERHPEDPPSLDQRHPTREEAAAAWERVFNLIDKVVPELVTELAGSCTDLSDIVHPYFDWLSDYDAFWDKLGDAIFQCECCKVWFKADEEESATPEGQTGHFCSACMSGEG